MKIGIRGKLITMFVLLITIPLIALGVGSYRKTLDMVQEDLQELSISTLDGIESSIDNYLKGYEQSLAMAIKDNSVQSILSHPEEKEAVEKVFKNFMDSHEDVLSIYLATKEKKMYSYPYIEYPSDYDPSKREWYIGAYNKNGLKWTQPYMDVYTQKLVVSVAAPVYDSNTGNEFVGIIAMDIDLDTLSKNINAMKIGKDGYLFLVDKNGNVMTHKDKSQIGKPVKVKEIVQAIGKAEQGVVKYDNQEEGKIKKKFAAFKTMKTTEWKMLGTLYVDQVLGRAKIMVYNTVVIGGISLLIALLISYLFSKYLTRAIDLLVYDMEKIKEGDFTIRTDMTRKDELGTLATNFNMMIDKLSHSMKNIQKVSYEVRGAAENLASTAQETSATAEEVAATFDEIEKGASSQAEDTEKGALFINNLADQLNELASNTREMHTSAKKVVQSNTEGFKKVEELKEKTELTSDATNKIEKAIVELNHKSAYIGDILNTITSIAQQTNLLALNASIEAARAGESGSGFAVVANEIRKLAEGSKEAVEEINSILHTIQEDTQYTVRIMAEVKNTFKDQSSAVLKVNDSFDVTSQALKEIMKKISGISILTNNINKEKDTIVGSIQNISSVSEETAASSKNVKEAMNEQAMAVEEVAFSADTLNNLFMNLEEEIKKFKIV